MSEVQSQIALLLNSSTANLRPWSSTADRAIRTFFSSRRHTPRTGSAHFVRFATSLKSQKQHVGKTPACVQFAAKNAANRMNTARILLRMAF